MIIEIITSTFIIYQLFKNKKTAAGVGRLYGNKITKSELKKLIRAGKSGGVNEDLFFENGIVYDLNTNEITTDYKEAINNTYLNNETHLRYENKLPIALSFESYFGFDNIEPTTDLEAYYRTLNEIANGKKWLWKDRSIYKGLESEIFGKNSPQERKYFKSIIDNFSGDTIQHYNETLSANDYREAIIQAIKDAPNKTAANNLLNEIYTNYLYNTFYNTIQSKEETLPF